MLKNSTLYVFRQSKSCLFGESKPCKECCEVIKKQKWIRWIVYSSDKGILRVKAKDLTSDYLTSAARNK